MIYKKKLNITISNYRVINLDYAKYLAHFISLCVK